MRRELVSSKQGVQRRCVFDNSVYVWVASYGRRPNGSAVKATRAGGVARAAAGTRDADESDVKCETMCKSTSLHMWAGRTGGWESVGVSGARG